MQRKLKLSMKKKFKKFFFIKDFLNYMNLLKFNKKSNSFLGVNLVIVII